MNYDFETVARTLPGNLKWKWTTEAAKKAGIVSFEAAEMDFPTAPSIIRSVTQMVQNGNFGFNSPTEEYFDAVKWWMKEARGWDIDTEWVVPVMGTIFSVATAIRLTMGPGDRLIIMSPIYNRYAQAARRMDLETVDVPMKCVDERYEIDFAGLEKAMSDPHNRLLILCNPSNPTGNVWTRDELTQLARLSARYGVYVFSDEIFAEVTFDGRRTIPYCEIPEGRKYAMVCTGLGKAFNFTGVNHANMIIPDPDLRERFTKRRTADHYGSLEPFAYASLMGAYCEEGLDWFREMLKVVGRNRQIVQEAMDGTAVPGRIFPVEGTYVGWIRWNVPGLSGVQLKEDLAEKALFIVEEGNEFGPGLENYTRVNLAATNAQTIAAMERVRQVFGGGAPRASQPSLC